MTQLDRGGKRRLIPRTSNSRRPPGAGHVSHLNVAAGRYRRGSGGSAGSWPNCSRCPSPRPWSAKVCFPKTIRWPWAWASIHAVAMRRDRRLQINRKADVVLAVGNSYRMPNGTDGRPIPSGVKLIHVNADAADLNKTYRADVAMLADAKLALRPHRRCARSHRSAGKGVQTRDLPRDSAARNKWLGHGMPIFTDPIQLRPTVIASSTI